jgi:hypothetical protein
MEVFQSFQYDDRYSQLLTLCNLIQTQASLSSSFEPIAVLIALDFARWHPQCAPGTVSGLVFNGLSYVNEHEKMVPIRDGLSDLPARGRGLCNNPT